MKELLTKKFWQDVRKTFDEARAETTPNPPDPQVASPADAISKASEAPVIPPPPEATKPQD
ncbi:MAG: hypothetical protein ABSE86_20265 [Bryobacteraceae bacterium]|jgi:hypothetical protein